MTAADRPPVTDNARAEAERRWPNEHPFRYLIRNAFVLGAEWAAGRAETTTATTEDAARVMRDEWMQYGPEVTWLHMARALDAHGLLATARTRPTREELIDALVMSPLSDTAGTDMRPFEQTADAVMALLRDGA